jgi:hypothetical protein
MTYDPTQPAAGTSPASARSTIQQNFNQANIAIGRDHIPFDGPSDEGRHRKVTLVEVQTGSDPVIAGPQTAVYSRTVDATQQLFFKNSAGEKQITSADVPKPTWPVHAFGRFSIDNTGTPTLLAGSYNVNGVVRFSGVGWNVSIEAAPNDKYVVLATAQAENKTDPRGYGTMYKVQSTTLFSLFWRSEAGNWQLTRASGFSFLVLVNS